MYIKDLEKFTKLHICFKCGYIPPASDHGCYNKERFENHVKNCSGKIETKLHLEEQSIPFIPHLFKNHLYSDIIIKVNTK
jgi:hypothetical protein